MSQLLTTAGLTASYGDFQALFGIDFEVDTGEVVAIIGANGAGKSTFLRSICGLLPVDPDRVRLDGAPIGGLPAHRIAARGVAMVPEGRRLFPSLSVEENLLAGAHLRRAGPWSLARVYELFPVLRQKRRSYPRTLSGGEQQMAAIGRALMARPRLLMIDELSQGLAPTVVDDLIDLLPALAREGTAVLLVEQDVESALAVASRGYVLELGSIVREGPAAALLEDPSLTEAYLGRG